MTRSPFAKVGPEPVLDDPRMTMKHFKVYWTIASAVPKDSNKSRMGTRLIAKIVKQSQRTVCRKIDDLIAWGHMTVAGENGHRSCYALTSGAFQVKAKEQRRNYKSSKAKPMTVRAAARALVDTAAARDEVLGA